MRDASLARACCDVLLRVIGVYVCVYVHIGVYRGTPGYTPKYHVLRGGTGYIVKTRINQVVNIPVFPCCDTWYLGWYGVCHVCMGGGVHRLLRVRCMHYNTLHVLCASRVRACARVMRCVMRVLGCVCVIGGVFRGVF